MRPATVSRNRHGLETEVANRRPPTSPAGAPRRSSSPSWSPRPAAKLITRTASGAGGAVRSRRSTGSPAALPTNSMTSPATTPALNGSGSPRQRQVEVTRSVYPTAVPDGPRAPRQDKPPSRHRRWAGPHAGAQRARRRPGPSRSLASSTCEAWEAWRPSCQPHQPGSASARQLTKASRCNHCELVLRRSLSLDGQLDHGDTSKPGPA